MYALANIQNVSNSVFCCCWYRLPNSLLSKISNSHNVTNNKTMSEQTTIEHSDYWIVNNTMMMVHLPDIVQIKWRYFCACLGNIRRQDTFILVLQGTPAHRFCFHSRFTRRRRRHCNGVRIDSTLKVRKSSTLDLVSFYAILSQCTPIRYIREMDKPSGPT